MSASLRANTEDSIAANKITADGKGMVVIGINKDGTLKESGIYACGEKIESLLNGVVFKGFKIPSFHKAVNVALEAHKQIPMFGAIAWDITIDKHYEPLVMEYN